MREKLPSFVLRDHRKNRTLESPEYGIVSFPFLRVVEEFHVTFPTRASVGYEVEFTADVAEESASRN